MRNWEWQGREGFDKREIHECVKGGERSDAGRTKGGKK